MWWWIVQIRRTQPVCNCGSLLYRILCPGNKLNLPIVSNLQPLVLQCMCSEMICDKAWGVTSFRETSVLSNLPSPSLEKTSVLWGCEVLGVSYDLGSISGRTSPPMPTSHQAHHHHHSCLPAVNWQRPIDRTLARATGGLQVRSRPISGSQDVAESSRWWSPPSPSWRFPAEMVSLSFLPMFWLSCEESKNSSWGILSLACIWI